MKKKLIAALCLILCVLLSGWIGYSIGNLRYQNSINLLSRQWDFDRSNPPLIAVAEAASALAEAYYQENVDLNGKNPRLTESVYFYPRTMTWRVLLMPEDYVLAGCESSRTIMTVGNGYSIDILAEDGTILSAEFGE